MAASILPASITKMSKPNQAELRRLMKEKLKQTSTVKKIDSPLAKYVDDQLTCIVCDCPVKTEALWLAHINGRVHKQNVLALKSKQAPAEFKRPASPPKVGKRKSQAPLKSPQGEKRIKIGEIETPAKNSKQSLRDLCKQLEDEDEEEEDSDDPKPQLPAGFFDEQMEVESEEKSSGNDLPEGFFDNPVVDAKVRNVEYKDPADVEWEKFQREIADVSHKSQAIIAEEEEESTAERQLEEVEEQLQNWAEVRSLQQKKAELEAKTKDVEMKEKSEDEESADEDYDELLDWRRKDCWR